MGDIMPSITYQITKDFDTSFNDSIHIKPQYANCLSMFKKGDQIHVFEFAKQHHKELTDSNDFEVARNVVGKSISIGKQLGIVERLHPKYIPFDEFCRFDTVLHLKQQLRKNHYKHKEASKIKNSGTQNNYLYSLWNFHNWLVGREFRCTTTVSTGQFTFEQKPQTVILEGIEHLLRLYESRPQNDPDFVRIIKKYLMDDMHKDKRWGTIDSYHSAILCYFKKNEFGINFEWDAKTLFSDVEEKEEEEPILSLEDLLHMLTTGKPTITEKAVILCKFHRGLDNSTFADRFNFEAWPQLVEWFGTENYEEWDIKKCPVPIKLTRIKTGYSHRGFLDVDAINALVKYLRYRQQKTNRPIQNGDAIILNTKNNPVNNDWVSRIIPKLAERSQIQTVLKQYKKNRRREKTSHELRDLLKSTLIASGTINYVCDLAIGHKVGDSYEKQDKLYPDKSRNEFAKASKMINIFSNISNYLKMDNEKEMLQQQIIDLKRELDKERKTSQSDISQIKEEHEKIQQWIKRQESTKKDSVSNVGVF